MEPKTVEWPMCVQCGHEILNQLSNAAFTSQKCQVCVMPDVVGKTYAENLEAWIGHIKKRIGIVRALESAK